MSYIYKNAFEIFAEVETVNPWKLDESGNRLESPIKEEESNKYNTLGYSAFIIDESFGNKYDFINSYGTDFGNPNAVKDGIDEWLEKYNK